MMQIHEFSLSELLTLLKGKTKRIMLSTFGAGIVGFLIAWCIPKEYESTASIIPETGEDASGLGGVSGLASMAGIDLSNGTDAIGPDLYPNVVSGNRFIVDLLYTPVQTVDGETKTDFMTYMKEYTRMPWWAYGRVYFGKMMRKLRPPKELNTRGADERINPERLTLDDERLVEGLKNTIGCQMDDKTGMLYISFRCQDPLVAKTMVDTIMTHLQQFITDYRTSKARTDLLHYRELEQEAKVKYEKAMHAYSVYCDSHMGTLLSSYQTQMESLENEMSVALNAYTQMKQQVQLAENKVQEKTPAFTVVESACVPAKHCAPHKLMMALALMFLTALSFVAWYYVRLLFGKEKKDETAVD